MTTNNRQRVDGIVADIRAMMAKPELRKRDPDTIRTMVTTIKVTNGKVKKRYE